MTDTVPLMPRLKKKWGQHHLTDSRVCRPLVEFLRPEGEGVVEIGPGGGVLTVELLRAGVRRVVGWELDLEWAFELRRRLVEPGPGPEPVLAPELTPELAVVAGDALEIPWSRFPAPTLAAGNLPYNVATPILGEVLRHHRTVPRAAFLVQKEVAARLTAAPGDPDYGYLSVLVAARADARRLGIVRRGAFRPPPQVDGAFVGFTLRPPPLPEAGMPAFLDTVGRAFALRRKTLRNSLAGAWGRAEADRVVAAAGLDPRQRAERLTLADFLALHQARSAG